MLRFNIRDILWLITVVALGLSLATTLRSRRQDRATIEFLQFEANYWKAAANFVKHESENKKRKVEFVPPAGVKVDGRLFLLGRPMEVDRPEEREK